MYSIYVVSPKAILFIFDFYYHLVIFAYIFRLYMVVLLHFNIHIPNKA